jgi:hypothetical protein
MTQPGQVRGQGAADLTGSEHDVRPILVHARILSPAESAPVGERLAPMS